MLRIVGTAWLAVFLVGCRAPTPSFNVLAPWGSATVPPPPTGSVGTSADYYAPPTPPPAASGSGAAPNRTSNAAPNSPPPSGGSEATGTSLQRGTPPRTFIGEGNSSAVAIDRSVMPASYTWDSDSTPSPAPALSPR